MVVLRLSVRNVSLDIESVARVLCLFGPSGSGKTTCLEGVAGLVRPDSGLIRLSNRTLFDDRTNLPPRLRRVGYLPQDAPLFPHLSVRGNLLYGAPGADPGPMAETLGLTELLDRPARRLSGGEQRRAALGRAILTRPEALLLDEPFSGLDAPLRARLLTFVARLDVPFMLLVTHDPRDALALADEVVRIENGREVERGVPHEVFGPHSPLVEPAAVLCGRVQRIEHGYAEVDVGGRTLHAQLPDAEEGEFVRLAIRADDVTLSLRRHDDLSARNQFEVRIETLDRRNEQVLAILNGGPRLFALLDQRSVQALGLEPGAKVFAQFKASALKRAGA